MPLYSLMSVPTMEREPDTQRSQPKTMPRLHILPDGVYTERDILPNTPYSTPKTVAALWKHPSPPRHSGSTHRKWDKRRQKCEEANLVQEALGELCLNKTNVKVYVGLGDKMLDFMKQVAWWRAFSVRQDVSPQPQPCLFAGWSVN